jgi:hypothetical protein
MNLQLMELLSIAGAMVAASAAGASDIVPPTWIKHEAGPTVHPEGAEQVLVGADGSVTVLGTAYLHETFDDVLLIRYSADGSLVWLKRFDSPEHASDTPGSMALAPDGGVWFSALHFLDEPRIEVTRLDASGEVVWAEERTVEGTDGIPNGVLVPKLAVDLNSEGPRIYVVVSDEGDYRILRFDDEGSEVWSTSWSGEGRFGDRPTDLAVSVIGDVYVTGVLGSAGYGTIGVSASGEVLWDHLQFGAIGSVLTDPIVRAHPDGGAVVAGSPETTCGTFEMRVWRIDDAGVEQWDVIAEDQQPCGTSFGPTGLAVAPDGRIGVCGPIVNPVGWRTVLFDGSGDELWQAEWLNPNSAGDEPMAIAFDSDGGAIVTGMRQSAPTMDAFGIIRYDLEGVATWHWQVANPTSGAGRSIALGADEAVFVAGRNWGGPAIGERAVTMRFDPGDFTCGADLDGDGNVDGADLGVLLSQWGAAGSGDLDGDGEVGGADLGLLLGAWGTC